MYAARLQNSINSVRNAFGEEFSADLAIVLGSGLDRLIDGFSIVDSLNYSAIEGFPHTTAPGHRGMLSLATVGSSQVLIFQGRFHLYEGWQPQDAAMIPRLAQGLGARKLILTNAVGALNPDWQEADVALIEDHINFTGHSPLTGENPDVLGPRFPDQSQLYNRGLLSLAHQAAESEGLQLRQGIYAGVAGPELETSAERRFLRMAGADVVGMSLIMEAIAANHCGLQVMCLAAVTNAATGDADQQADTLETVMANAAIAGKKIAKILPAMLKLVENHKG